MRGSSSAESVKTKDNKPFLFSFSKESRPSLSIYPLAQFVSLFSSFCFQASGPVTVWRRREEERGDQGVGFAPTDTDKDHWGATLAIQGQLAKQTVFRTGATERARVACFKLTRESTCILAVSFPTAWRRERREERESKSRGRGKKTWALKTQYLKTSRGKQLEGGKQVRTFGQRTPIHGIY